MRKVKTVSVSLEPEFVNVLDKLARTAGSRSNAVRTLLKELQVKEWEKQYREYYADPRNVREARELTMEMRSIASWPEEWYAKPKKKRRGRKRLAR